MRPYRKKGNAFPTIASWSARASPCIRPSWASKDVTALPRRGAARAGSAPSSDARHVPVAARHLRRRDPGGGDLAPSLHLYEKGDFRAQGRGVAQVWQGAGDKLTFEWGWPAARRATNSAPRTTPAASR